MLLVVSIPDLENPSFTVVLLDNFTGAAGATDIDTNNDGVADDTSTFGTVLDALGIPDSNSDATTMYGTGLGGADFAYTGDEPQLVFRDGSTGDWYAVNDSYGVADTDAFDINGVAVPGTNFDVDPTGDGTNATTTFGSANPSNITASAEDRQIEGFSFSPNPTALGYVNIFSRSQTTMKVNVFDILGKQVINSSITNNRLNVSNLSPGLYIMQLTQNNATVTKKLVIQ